MMRRLLRPRMPLWLALLLLGSEWCALALLVLDHVEARQAQQFTARIAEIRAEISDAPVEIGYIIAANGRIIDRRAGTATRIVWPVASLRHARGAYLIHNHPRQRDCRLSPADIALAKKWRLSATEAICSNGSRAIWPVSPGGTP